MKKHLAVLSLCLVFFAAMAFAHGDMQHVMGTVTRVSSDSITVKTTKGEVITLAITTDTQFTKGKTPAKIADLKAGDKVVIHVKKDEKDSTKLVAHTVMIGEANGMSHHDSHS